MEEDGSLRRAGRAGVVVYRDRVQQLCRSVRGLEHAQAEVHVAEQPSVLRRPERGRRAELPRAPDVVDERRPDEQIRAQARMELRTSRQIVATPTVCSSSPPAYE